MSDEATTDIKWRTWEHEDRDEEWDKMEWNKNTRLMCQWLMLNPLKGTKDVTSIYSISKIKYLYNILDNIPV